MIDRPARILFVDHSAVLGGAQLSLLDIAIAMKGRAAVALFEDGPLARRLVGNGVALLPLDADSAIQSVKKSSTRPSLSALLALAGVTRHLAGVARPYAVVVANSPKSFLVSAVAGWMARRPVVWHLRDILDPHHFSATNIRVMVRVANMRAARVIANSQATADAFVTAGGKRSLVVVVHNGIDASAFAESSANERAMTRAEFGFDSDDFIVGSFSRLHPWKGPQVLLDALELLDEPKIKAILVGGALFSGEQAFEGELRQRISQPPLRDRVYMLGVRDDIPRLMRACDVIAHTSVLPEPFGRVLVEALLAERPLVASDAGGVREVVSNGLTGMLTPPGDAPALAAALRAIRLDPPRARALALAGAVDVRRRFTVERLISGVRQVLDDVMSKART